VATRKSSHLPSMISFDSLLSDNPETPPAIEGAPHATESQAKHTSSQAIEPSASGSRACSSASVYRGLMQPRVHLYDTTNTSSKIETSHFWCVIFSHESYVNPIFIDETLCTSRLETCCTASTDISSRVTRYTFPPDSPCLTSVTTKLSLPSYP